MAEHAEGGTEQVEQPDVRWLDAEEMEAWMALVGVVMKLPTVLDRQLQRDAGLTHFEYIVLAVLSEAPERTMRMSAIAKVIEGQLPRLSQVTARLEKRGWLTRRPDPADGRCTLATLTDEGMTKVVASAPGHVGSVRRSVFDGLTKAQVRQLRDIGRRILQSVDKGLP